jgi:HTH DNA binding domain
VKKRPPAIRARRATGTRSTRHRLRALRDAEGEDTTQRLLLATLKVRIPKDLWTGPFSSRHPALRLEVLNRTEVSSDVSVSDYWIGGGGPGEWAAEIASYPDVLQADSLATVGEGCLYRIKYRNPPVVGVYRRLRLPLQFPLRIQGGFITWEIVGRYGEFRTILEHARSADGQVEVVSLRRRALRSHLPMLTDAQHALLTEAMAAGYFAVPRGITLTDLARKLDRSKSSVSEGIAVIEKKLVESALSAGSIT